MFGIFKKNKSVSLFDLDDNPLKEGDEVMSLRYDLGQCTLVQEDGVIYYESNASKERVSWVKMIDAVTEKQKVRKIDD